MADKQIKELEKVFAQEAKVDQQQIERAKKEMRKVEKLYKASIKETEKAQKAVEKAGKSRLKAQKAVHKAEKMHSVAETDVDKAQRLITEMNERESLEEQDVQQRHNQVSEVFGEFHAKEHSRIRRRSEVLAVVNSHPSYDP